jgi:hypothetical protein
MNKQNRLQDTQDRQQNEQDWHKLSSIGSIR